MNRKYLSRMLTILLSMAMIVTSMSLAFATDQEPVQSDEQNVAEETVPEVVPEDTDAEEDAVVEDTDAEENSSEALLDSTAVSKPVLDASHITRDNSKGSKPDLTVTWDPVESETSETVYYAIRIWTSTKPFAPYGYRRVNSLTATEHTFMDIDANKTYSIQVGAYTDSGLYPIDETEYDKTDTTTDGWALDDSNVVWSDPITYTVPVTVGKVKNLKIKQISKDDNWYKITWDDASGEVGHYYIFMDKEAYKGPKDLPKKARRLSGSANSFKIQLKEGTHTFRVKTISPYSTNDAVVSSKIKVKVKLLSKVHPSMDWKVVFYKKTPLYKSRSGYAKIKTIKKKTKGAIALDWSPSHISDWGTPSRIQVKLKNGKKGWVPYSYVDIVADNTWKKSYAKSAILKYVNQFGSANKYLIWCNKYTSRVYIFEGKKGNWKLKRTCKVTVGKFYQPVSTSTSKTLGARYGRVYHLTENGTRYYFDYARTFHGSGYFHTRSYWASGGQKNTIQLRPNTRGCVRMYTDDAKYLYTLPVGTKVIHK